MGRRLTLVSAPPGFGKTTLVSGWIHQADRPAAWLSLDGGDNEPGRFLLYLFAALQNAREGLGKTAAALLQTLQPPPLDAFLTLLINDLAQLTNRIILVLDDYHVIHNLDIHKGMTFLLQNQPPQLHVILISRSDPTFPLHRLRGSGQMTGIYAQNLRFSKEETAAFLSETMRTKLSEDDVLRLTRRTEGWVAGLQMAALSMQNMPDPGQFVTTFAGDDRYITDYLIGEVFEGQPLDVQDFLLKTSIVERFTAPLCAAILIGHPGSGEFVHISSSQKMIDDLEQANLFLVCLDNKREWYRYHHLFLDFLRRRMEQLSADEVAGLHRRAAAWFEDQGNLAAAIEQALAGSDQQRAARLIEENALETIFGYAQWATLFAWMARLPPDLIRARPRLSIQYAWALFASGNWQEAAHFLLEIEPAFENVEATAVNDLLRGEVATIGGLVAYANGDIQAASARARRALSYLANEDLTQRCVSWLTIGEAALIQEEVLEARQALQQAVDEALAAGNVTIAVFALGDLARLEMMAGYLERAAEHYRQARTIGTIAKGTLLGPTGISFLQMGEVLREWNALDEAEQVLREGLALSRRPTGLLNIVFEGLVNLARVLLAKGQEERAVGTMQEAESLLADLLASSSNIMPAISPALAGRLRFWLAQGKSGTSARWLAAHDITPSQPISAGTLAYHVILAHALIAGGSLKQMREQLDKLQKAAARRESPRLSVEMLILQALWQQAQGQVERAVQRLAQAVGLAEAQGFIRLFVDCGLILAPLLQQLAGQQPPSTYLQKILEALPVLEETRTGEPFKTVPLTTGLIEPLKHQELRILRLMSAGLSNKEIARELHLSVNTIKVYASRIYSKMSVRSRAEAVSKAHELRIL